MARLRRPANAGSGLFRTVLFAALIVLFGACSGSDGDIALVADVTSSDSEDPLGYALAGEEVMGHGPALTVQAGEEVTLTLENQDTLEAHNLAVVPQLDDIPTLAALGGLDEEIVWGASIDDLAQGETGSVTFTPDAPGNYYYVCTLPGHAKAGMMGELIVVDEG